jgi:hypothetical protein
LSQTTNSPCRSNLGLEQVLAGLFHIERRFDRLAIGPLDASSHHAQTSNDDDGKPYQAGESHSVSPGQAGSTGGKQPP